MKKPTEILRSTSPTAIAHAGGKPQHASTRYKQALLRKAEEVERVIAGLADYEPIRSEWSEEEIRILRDNIEQPIAVLAELLPGRTRGTINQKKMLVRRENKS